MNISFLISKNRYPLKWFHAGVPSGCVLTRGLANAKWQTLEVFPTTTRIKKYDYILQSFDCDFIEFTFRFEDKILKYIVKENKFSTIFGSIIFMIFFTTMFYTHIIFCQLDITRYTTTYIPRTTINKKNLFKHNDFYV